MSAVTTNLIPSLSAHYYLDKYGKLRGLVFRTLALTIILTILFSFFTILTMAKEEKLTGFIKFAAVQTSLCASWL